MRKDRLSACLFSSPSRLLGMPTTTKFVSFSLQISAILFTDFIFFLLIVSNGEAIIPIISDLATPILTSPISSAIYLFILPLNLSIF